jgi:uncharacterized membrane protein YkvA (DUF1232 family)
MKGTMEMKALQKWARKMKREVFALYFAYQDPRTPFWAKAVTVAVVAYAFSPVDLIPDFIPLLGYLDDLILIPLGIALAIRMIPEPVLEDSRRRAYSQLTKKPRNWVAGALILLVWTLGILALLYIVYQQLAQ